MWKTRIFNQENLFKMDKLINYLKDKKISYTFHSDRNKDKLAIYKVFWLSEE